MQHYLKCGFLKKSFIMNAPLVSCPLPVITFGCCTYPKVMTGNGQLTRGAFIINDFLRNPHFSNYHLHIFVEFCFAIVARTLTLKNLILIRI